MLTDRAGSPACGQKSHHGNEDEEEQENREGNPVDPFGHDSKPRQQFA
jgi:hypothetical protein